MPRTIELSDRAEWLRWRRSGIGASDAAVVAGRSPFTTRQELYLEKKGRLPEKPATKPMLVGLAMEPVIAACAKRRCGVEFESHQVALQSDDHPFMLATLDGVTRDGRIWEFKAPGVWSAREIGEEGETDSLPEHWIIQGQHQACVAEAAGVTVATIFPTIDLIHYLLHAVEHGISEHDPLLDDLDFRTFPVPRNQGLIDSIVSLNGQFWANVLDDIPPYEVEPSDAQLLSRAFQGEQGEIGLDRETLEAMEAWVDLGPKIKALEDERDAAKARVLVAMGNAAIGYCPGGKTIKRSVVETAERTAKSAGEVIRKASRSVRIALKGASS
jgi:putative phage-type endonuclease